jgi:hypothetical protein
MSQNLEHSNKFETETVRTGPKKKITPVAKYSIQPAPVQEPPVQNSQVRSANSEPEVQNLPTKKFSLSSLIKRRVPQQIIGVPTIKEPVSEQSEGDLQYQNYSELLNKAVTREAMTHREVQALHAQIKLLDQEAHIEICRILIEEMGTDVLMVNNYGTYIDLVELPDHVLWRINYYVKLCQEDQARRTVKDAARKQWQQDLLNNQQYQKMRQAGTGSHPNIFHQTIQNYSPDNLPSYDDLRSDALRNLLNSQQSVVDSYGLVSEVYADKPVKTDDAGSSSDESEGELEVAGDPEVPEEPAEDFEE